MILHFILLFLQAIVVTDGKNVKAGSSQHRFTFTNQCPFTVWVGALGAPGKVIPQGGGWRLNSRQSNTIELPDHWSGRFWGRTNCVNGACETGDCGRREQCQGAGGQPPATLAEFTLNGDGGKDYYDVSLVDGYNLPMRIATVPGTWVRTSGDRYDCTTAGCNSDLNAICPAELRVQKNGHTIACKSACEALNTDVYCCRGAHNKPETCKSTQWPVNYPSVFKRACPDAYSYAYDDHTSTFTCKGNPAVSYHITFCP